MWGERQAVSVFCSHPNPWPQTWDTMLRNHNKQTTPQASRRPEHVWTVCLMKLSFLLVPDSSWLWNRHMNFLLSLFLPLSQPPHSSSPPSPPPPWTLSVIQHCVSAPDFELDAPRHPAETWEAGGLAWNLSYLACSHEQTHSLHPTRVICCTLIHITSIDPSSGRRSPAVLKLPSDWSYVWKTTCHRGRKVCYIH